MPNILDELRHYNILRDKEWNPEKLLTPLFRACELGGEVGEALNVIKKLEREHLGLVGSRATLDQLGEELADVIICVDLLAMEYKLDLATFIVRKFNKTSHERELSILMPEGYY